MERLYSLRQYSSIITWLFSVSLSLLFSQIYWELFNSASGHIFLTGLLLALAVDQGIELLPQFTERFKRHRAFHLMKASAFMVVAIPAFAMILKGGFLFTATVGILAFAFTEIFDFLKPYLSQMQHVQQLKPARQVKAEPKVDVQRTVVEEPMDPLNESLEKHFKNKTILITGAGRYELTLKLASFHPTHMILVDDHVDRLNETFELIREKFPRVKVTPFLKTSDHRVQIQHIFESFKPEVILYGAFETHGAILDQNPSYVSRMNVVDAIDWVESARKHGVPELALLLPTSTSSQTAQQCLAIVHRYCLGLQGVSANHPTRILVLEQDDVEATLAQYLHALSNQVNLEPVDDFPMFQRALHQLEWAVSDFNNNEVRSLLDALAPLEEEQMQLAA